jgi:class 3 adenylate cyclase
MPSTTHGSLEVEQTLRLARDAVEADIARYRIGVFLVVVAVTGVLHAMRFDDTWIPTLFFLGVTTYSVLVLAYLKRFGNPPALALVTLFVDLGVGVAIFQVMRAAGGQDAATSRLFATYILAPGLLMTVLINTLRNSVASSIGAAVMAPAAFLLTLLPLVGFFPAQVPVTMLLLLAGLISVASARQARKNIDTFARLQLLRRYLPPEAVERVMRDDPDAALALGGRLVTVTMLAADLRGFTAMSEKLPPREVMAQLNAYHGAMVDVIDRHGGAIDKFIGDGTLVVFGLSGSVEDGATAAVACAAAMLEALTLHNEERGGAGAEPLAMGIGVHTGSVVAGNLGVPGRRLEFTVIGDAVNTTSRLEGHTKQAGTPVVVSEATVAVLRDPSVLRELAPVSLRGKQMSLRVYGLARLVGLSSAPQPL